ncbi:hypothetical protein ACHAQA_000127 [Verticillium albo-atrum]
MRRKYGELEVRNSNLEHLFAFIQEGPETDIAAVIRRIREGADLDAVGMHIRDGDLLMQLSVRPDMTYLYTFPFNKDMPARLAQDSSIPYVNSLLYKNTVGLMEHPEGAQPNEQEWQKVYTIPFHAVEVVDRRIDLVTASQWTAITVSDVVVRKLLGVYFILQHPFYTFFQKDPFLEDMVSGRDRYCSPLLFNAVMAEACHGYSAIPERYRFWDPRKLTYQFMSEARRLWELEMKSGVDRITTIHASMVICACYSSAGLDQLGTEYLAQGIKMAQRMKLFEPLTFMKSSLSRKVYSMTAWAIFGYQGMFAFHMWQDPLLTEPPKEPLAEVAAGAEQYGEIWVKYPLRQALLPVQFGETFIVFSQLRTIMAQIAHVAARKRAHGLMITASEAAGFRTRLVAWFNSLPRFLSPGFVALPAHLKIHMQYHNVMLALYDSLADPRRGSPTTAYREICAHSRSCLDVLVRLYYLRHGFESWNDSLATWILYLAQLCVRDLARAEDPLADEATVSTLLLCAKGLQDQGRSLYVSRVFFHIVRNEVPPQVKELLDRHVTEIERDHSKTGTGANHLRASWPVRTISISEEPDRLLEKLSLEDRKTEYADDAESRGSSSGAELPRGSVSELGDMGVPTAL